MSIENEVNKLVALERDVRTLEKLIQYIGSLNEEELTKAWPRILKVREALERQVLQTAVTKSSEPEARLRLFPAST